MDRIAAEINRDFHGRRVLMLGVLKGSFIFMADIIRRLEVDTEVEFVTLSSYGGGTKTSGRVKVVRCLRIPVKGRKVIVVEDIVDSGITLDFFLKYLMRRKPASVKVCALLDKASRREVPVSIDYCGFTIPDKFVVGYGIDYGEKYRNLPGIYYL